MNRLCYNKNYKSHQRVVRLISSLMGGGGSMKFFKKLSVLIKLLKLIIDLYHFFN